jgi:hypothetical protein
MEKVIITNHTQLLERIAELKKQKNVQELELQDTFKEIALTLNLVSLFKKSTTDNRPLDLAKSGVNMVLDLIIDLSLGKYRSIKGYLSAVMVERFTAMLVESNILTIISGIQSLFSKKSKHQENQD